MNQPGQIHVLHVLNSAHGGSAISTFELIEALQIRGVKSSLVCFNNADAKQAASITAMVDGRVLFIPLYWMNKRIRSAWWKRPAIAALSLWKTRMGYRYQDQISRLIQQHGVSLVHTSTILNPEGAIAAKANCLPHLWHVRELIGPTKHFHFYNYKKWSTYVLQHSRYLIANSSVTQQCLLEFFPPENIKTIPNGIKVNNFKVKTHTNNKPQLIVGMIGSVTTRWKNHSLFIRVAQRFKGRNDVMFKIYGALPPVNDPYYKELRDMVSQLDLKALLKFEQFKSPPQIVEEIDVMFHPTELESFGRIFVEAMAGGIPVIGINQGGALEMVREGVNGFLIDKNDIEAACRKLTELIENPQRRNQFGRNGRRSVEENYSIDLMTDRIIELYQKVVAS